jgi:uncharacterized membrane protein YcjF (UPF0283 family)
MEAVMTNEYVVIANADAAATPVVAAVIGGLGDFIGNIFQRADWYARRAGANRVCLLRIENTMVTQAWVGLWQADGGRWAFEEVGPSV